MQVEPRNSHNILGENVLGLPKEPATDRGVAFKDVGGTSEFIDLRNDALRLSVGDDFVAVIELAKPPNNFFSMDPIGGLQRRIP